MYKATKRIKQQYREYSAQKKGERKMLTFNYPKETKKTKFMYDRIGVIIKHNNKDYELISKTTMLNRYAAITKRCEVFEDDKLSIEEYWLIEEQDEKGNICREIISSVREK